MKRLVLYCVALSFATLLTVGCDKQVTTERKETVTTPGGSTTTTDAHTVESSGKNAPSNAAGEKAK